MLEKLESFIKRLRWKAFFFDKKNEVKDHFENFGFNTDISPPQHENLIPFEKDLYQLMKSIQFKPVKNAFQQQLTTDIRKIKTCKSVIVSADKTTNLYKVDANDYKKLLRDNITAKYERSNNNALDNINSEAKAIATELKLDNRIEQFASKNAFITIKDHKPNFPSNIKCRLINPAKSQIGKISKKILDKINCDIRSRAMLAQWRNSNEVINWFNHINNKSQCKFLVYDIVDFYPSISESLLTKAIEFAQSYTHIDQKTKEIIIHSRKSLLFKENEPWSKIDGNSNFDVTMGSYDGAEVCELVGLFLLQKINNILGNNNSGLYRDDGLAITRKCSGPQLERIKKKIIKLFQSFDLKITVESNLSQVNFLDITFNLNSNKFWPFRKPNDIPLYIHAKSNHPPSIIKEVPRMVLNRLASLSCTKSEFEKSAPPYIDALKKSNFKVNLNHTTFPLPPKKKTRKRNIIWFNPPFNENVKTNVGKTFLSLIKKHFPPYHRFHKIFNNNNIKISYSCMPSMKQLISNHNNKILNSKNNLKAPPPCNCRNKKLCPLQGKCREKSVIYKAIISSPTHEEKHYYGSCETEFKLRYNNHNQSFKNYSKRNATELSKHFWKIKNDGQQPVIKWNILERANSYQCGGKKCNLCLAEKLTILKSDTPWTLNKRTELMAKCRHKTKYKLHKFV